jgi:hypothetical protein
MWLWPDEGKDVVHSTAASRFWTISLHRLAIVGMLEEMACCAPTTYVNTIPIRAIGKATIEDDIDPGMPELHFPSP